MSDSVVTVDFCGELHEAPKDGALTIGREGDVEIDDNPFLHRHFLQVTHEGGWWWLTNIGTTLTATVADKKGLFQAWLNPGARIPLAFERVTVWFTAGPTTYDFDVVLDTPSFQMVDNEAPPIPMLDADPSAGQGAGGYAAGGMAGQPRALTPGSGQQSPVTGGYSAGIRPQSRILPPRR